MAYILDITLVCMVQWVTMLDKRSTVQVLHVLDVQHHNQHVHLHTLLCVPTSFRINLNNKLSEMFISFMSIYLLINSNIFFPIKIKVTS